MDIIYQRDPAALFTTSIYRDLMVIQSSAHATISTALISAVGCVEPAVIHPNGDHWVSIPTWIAGLSRRQVDYFLKAALAKTSYGDCVLSPTDSPVYPSFSKTLAFTISRPSFTVNFQVSMVCEGRLTPRPGLGPHIRVTSKITRFHAENPSKTTLFM